MTNTQAVATQQATVPQATKSGFMVRIPASTILKNHDATRNIVGKKVLLLPETLTKTQAGPRIDFINPLNNQQDSIIVSFLELGKDDLKKLGLHTTN